MIFTNRREAGRWLAQHVAEECVELERPLVLGLPRGGVPVAAEVAGGLGAELDVLIVRKIGAPTQPELAVGAIASGDVLIVNDALLTTLGIGDAQLTDIIHRETVELHRREQRYRSGHAQPDMTNRDVLLVDDGVATGSTMLAAIEAARRLDARRVIVAVPHGAPDSIATLTERADQVVCIETPQPYMAVGYWYATFGQVSDDEVTAILDDLRHANSSDAAPGQSKAMRQSGG